MAHLPGNEVKQMKTMFLKPTLNPAFKITQPLPMLPQGFVARHAWAARPLSVEARPVEASSLNLAASNRCVMRLETEIHSKSARLVA